MNFNGGRQFGHRALTILGRIGLLIWCNQLCRIEHADLAESLGVDSRGFFGFQNVAGLEHELHGKFDRGQESRSDSEAQGVKSSG